LRVAYLVNQYPRTSHSFIRREILAVEAEGVEVLRFSVRPLDEPLPSEIDRLELERTRVVLDAGPVQHTLALAEVAVRRPAVFARAVAKTVQLGWRSERGLLRHFAYLAEACVLARWLRRADGADHVHAHFGTNAAAVALLCHAVGGPTYSFTVHGSEEFDKPEFLGLAQKIRQASFAVAISNFARAQLCRWADHADWAKIHVVRCGIDEELLRAPTSPTPAAPRLVCVARLVQLKGHLILIEAAERLAAEGLDFEIVLAGDGPFREPIEAAIRRAGLDRRIRVAGVMSADQVRDVIQASRALVLPSFSEGLPMVVVEALALRRPVITTAIAGIPELVATGETGWLVPAGSVDALTDAMRDALQSPPARLDEMGRAGAARVAKQHNARAEARRLIEFLRPVVAARHQEGVRVPG
jgi:glycosyltransferase involved in cell wall biosynthesis